MKILLAAPRGFCAGVNMAIESLDVALRAFGPPVYVYHEIVHNRYVVETFRERGAVFVNDLEQVPEGSYLLFSAHGVAPEVRRIARQRRLTAIDATCPLVTKVHLEAIRFAKEGYLIVLIGHEGHDEVVGTMGEAPHCIVLVESEEDVDRLPAPSNGKIAYLTQTTLSVDDANRIIRRLKERFPQIVGPPKEDICYATQNRQEAVRLLAAEADVALVVGSQNSSNSQRLKEIAGECGIPAYLVDGPQDIDLGWFSADDTVLMTAGASAPEKLVEECIAFLEQHFPTTIETRVVRTEEVHFPLPRELRGLPLPS
ncbi:MAG: 4-hydroxy-3-methylbut-2-enyl diphosphate reductase [Pirellulaceae bacterium]|nr:MAG: 4-hydroxy-3-methylbut-2-enyl diphosphate reductase [Pirellulaceae bacterium]